MEALVGKRSQYRMADSDLSNGLNHFRTVPWARALLEDPAYNAVPTPSRRLKESTEDAIIAETLNTNNTIKAWLTLQRIPTAGALLITETRTLLSLDFGINGYPGIVHGGMVGLLFDETMGTLLQLNAYAGTGDAKAAKDAMLTAWLKITFLRPVPTPAVVVVTARLREIKGRKIYVDAEIGDGAGNVLAKGEALWIQARERQTKL